MIMIITIITIIIIITTVVVVIIIIIMIMIIMIMIMIMILITNMLLIMVILRLVIDHTCSETSASCSEGFARPASGGPGPFFHPLANTGVGEENDPLTRAFVVQSGS